MAALSNFIVTRNNRYVNETQQLLQDDGAPEYVYHNRTALCCVVFVDKRYGSKGYPQRNAAHVR
jgi:hypothetical protein